MKTGLSRALLPLQCIIVANVLLWLAVAPPVHGSMLLLPLTPGSGAHLATDVIDRGARLLARGPIPGSIIVSGDRAAIANGLLARGILVVSVPELLCGGSLETSRR